MHLKNRVLLVSIAVSFAAHVMLFLWFQHKKQMPMVSKRGVVSVDFIESVHHEAVQATPRTKPRQKDVNPSPEKVESAASPQPQNSEQASPEAIESASKSFIISVMTLLQKNKVFPQEAIDREQEGKVVVGLTLDREGLVLAASIETASPFQVLNDAALKTVSTIGRFPRVPDAVPVPIHLHVPLVYRIEHN